MNSKNFFAQLKRRNVIRFAGLYLVGAWLLVQVAGTLLPVFDAPAWVMKTLVGLLAIGFGPALIFSWAFELTPQGLKRDEDVRPEESIAPQTARRMNRMIIAVLVLALGYFGFDKFVFAPRREAALVAAAAPSHPASTPNETAATSSAKSIAVLPFVDMSQGKDQEYFSDGLSEQLLNALAQLPELHVAGRTSSFYFKGRNEDLRVIGEKLNVATVLEGSVAKSGNTLRISAQLINAADGYQLWSHTYDRQFKDVFALQDDIAGNVVAALKLKLLPGQAPVAARSVNPEAYNQYLLGRNFMRQDSADAWKLAVDAFGQAVALDPGYAPAYAALAEATFQLAYYSTEPAELSASLARALRLVERAIELDPNLADGYRVRATIRSEAAFNVSGAMADIERALKLNAGSSASQEEAGSLLIGLGRFDEALSSLRKAVDLDPLSVRALGTMGRLHRARGEWSESEVFYGRAWQLAPDSGTSKSGLAITYLLQGNYPKALEIAERQTDEGWRLYDLALVQYSLGNGQQADLALNGLIQRHSAGWAYQIAAVYAWRGKADQAFAWLDRAYEQRDGGWLQLKSDLIFKNLRADPRYAAMLKKVGL